MQVAVVQTDIRWCDPEANFAALGPRIEIAASLGASLVVLPETFPTGFVTDRPDLAEPAGGAAEQFLAGAAESCATAVCGSYFRIVDDDAGPAIRNTFTLVESDGSVHRYDKHHPFAPGGESAHVGPGDGAVVIELGGVRIAPLVCYDLRFAPLSWGVAADTDCYLVVANWPSMRRSHWRTLLRARAIENQAYVVACNRVGPGGGLDHAGDSAVIDPLGRTLAEAAFVETTVTAEVDPAMVVSTRNELPFLGDRRP